MKKILLIAFIVLAGTVSAQGVTSVINGTTYRYEGQVDTKGRPEGEGMMRWSDARFEGTFHKGNPVKGTFTKYQKGKVFYKSVGSFTTKKHPKGQLNSTDVLEHGYVEATRLEPNGLVYKGKKKNGLCEGYGECLFFDEVCVDVGNWHNNFVSGNARRIYKDRTMRGYYDSYAQRWLNGSYFNNSEEENDIWNKWYPYYVYCKMTGWQGCLDDLKNTGSAMVLPQKDPSRFILSNDVRWSGEVLGGKLQGQGTGFVAVNGEYLVIDGSFEDGVLQGKGKYKYLDKEYVVEMGEKSNGYTSYLVDGKYGFVNDKGGTAVPAIYKRIIAPFNNEGYAVVLNDKNEEVKVNYVGRVLGYTEHQEQLFAKAKREAELQEMARKADELRKAEEKRKAERKENETRKYNTIKGYYESFNDAAFATAYDEYMKEYSSDGNHRDEINIMNENTKTRESRIAAGKDIKKWRMGNQVCVSYNGKILLGLVNKFNEDRSAAEIKVLFGPSGDYNGQTLKKDGTIWIQANEGWHLAIEEEISSARSRNSLYEEKQQQVIVNEGPKLCSECSGRGTQICWRCDGKGRDYDGKLCYVCQGKGSYKCRRCNGRGQ